MAGPSPTILCICNGVEAKRIAVEVKGLSGPSEMTELERAIGQFTLYRLVLAKRQPDSTLYHAVPIEVMKDVFQKPIGQLLIEGDMARVVGFDPAKEEIVQWLN